MFLLQLYGSVIPGGGSVIVGYGVAEDGEILSFIFIDLTLVTLFTRDSEITFS